MASYHSDFSMSDYSPKNEDETNEGKTFRLNDLRKRSMSYEREQANILRNRRREVSSSVPESSPEADAYIP